MDKYLVELGRVIANLEDVCGLNMKNPDGVEYRKLSINDVLAYCAKSSKSIPRESLKELNVIAGRQTAKLTVIMSKLSYYGKRKLTFEQFPCLDQIAKTLLGCTKKAYANSISGADLQTVSVILETVERKDVTAHETLSFRFIRVLLCLIIYGCKYNAGVIAEFLIKQMSTK